MTDDIEILREKLKNEVPHQDSERPFIKKNTTKTICIALGVSAVILTAVTFYTKHKL